MIDVRQFILRDNDKRMMKKYPVSQNQPSNEEFRLDNKSPPINFIRSNSTFKKTELPEHLIKNYKYPEEKEYNNKIISKFPETIMLNKATTLPEVSEKDIMSYKLYLDLKIKYENEKEKTAKLKKLLYEKETEIQNLKQDKMQLYNKVTMMDEQIRNYEVAFEERSTFFPL